MIMSHIKYDSSECNIEIFPPRVRLVITISSLTYALQIQIEGNIIFSDYVHANYANLVIFYIIRE